MQGAARDQPNSSFAEEVTSRFGVFPNFFCSAPAADALVEELWKFAKAGYLDSPLPSLFKERLFVYLSRFCEVRYCIVRHVGFLIGEGRPAGDASVTPQTIDEVLVLLTSPLPVAEKLVECLERLESCHGPVAIPVSGTRLENDLFAALATIFIEPRRSEHARRSVASAFGECSFEVLMAFLAFVRTAHFWTETHPALAIEPDMVAVMATHDELARLLLDESEAAQAKAGAAMRRSLLESLQIRDERAKIAEALRISEQRLGEVLRVARMAYWVGNSATETINASDTMADLFGLTCGEKFLNRRQWFTLVHPEDLPPYQAKVDEAIQQGTSWHHQFRIVRPCDGNVGWMEEHGHATRDPHSGIASMAGLVWDTTERTLLQVSLHEADRRKDEFLAMLAHELRNPLAVLRNGMQIAQLKSTADSSFSQTLEMMDRQLTHLVHLVDDLLDVSRIGSGKLELRKDTISLADSVRRSVEAVRTAIDARGHELIIELGTVELFVEGDLERLTQIFSNLLTNAAKYTDPGGKIELQVTHDGDWAIVSVTDNGVGIPSEDLSTVFELSQVRAHEGRANGGLGIGLSLVRRLVDLHHGTVTARSRGSGQGSTFLVRLPVVAQVEKKCEQTASATLLPSIGLRQILVVDDSVDAADSLAALLKLLGHEVAIAYSGEEGVIRARRSPPDVVFLDLGMPGMDGFEAAVRFRSLPGGNRTTLIALTGLGQEIDHQRTKDNGFDRHLVKPIALDELKSALSDISSACAV